MYEKTMIAGWGDMDFNSHMRNTAYLDKSADVRMSFFAEHGFTMDDFRRMRIGPVIRKDALEYFKEVGLLTPLRVTLTLSALSEDGGQWEMQNEFFRPDGKLAARVTSSGGWLDLGARRLVAPPPELLAALRTIPRAQGSGSQS